MKWPWVSRDRYDEMKEMLSDAISDGENRIREWKVRHETIETRLLGLLEPTDPPDVEMLPIPDLPEVIEQAMFDRATPGTFTWEGLRKYALDEMRKNVDPADIAQAILTGGSL